ncbi:MAG: radical SAM protein [Tepidisphaerales bacterium]
MLFAPRILGQRLKLGPVSHIERRDGNVLLVWADLPHWMVVDAEMHGFLGRLDGSRTVAQAVEAIPRAERRGLLQTVKSLMGRGVLHDPANPAPSEPPKGERRPQIENVAINLTRRCNLRCSFCYGLDRLTSNGADELTAAEISTFLDQVRPFSSKRASVILLGGEPLLNPEKLLAVAAHAAHLGFMAVVSTNGIRITPEFARQARKTGLQVQVSLDGHTPQLHDAIRGAGSFDKTLGGIRTLVAQCAHTVLSLVCHEGNISHLAEFYALALSLKVNEARFIPMKLMGGAAGSGLRPVGMSELMRVAADLFRQHPEYLKLAGRDAFSILANTCRLGARRLSCGTGLQTVLLDADGGLYPCLNTDRPQFRLGGVRDPGYCFRDLWMGSPVLASVRRCSAMDTPERACSKCSVRYWCLGGCRGETFAVTGDLAAPSPHCAELHRAVLDIMWLVAESPGLVRPATYIC